MKADMNEMVEMALEGDRDAVTRLIRSVQDRVYALSLKMLYSTSDAEDAAQEILIKIITRLEGFRKESSFQTWAMKIASNHLLSRREKLARTAFTFESCEEMIHREIPDRSSSEFSQAEQGLLVNEMRVLCVQGLFQCLDRNHRVAYILSATMDVTGSEGAAILGISAANFRKRVSRARIGIREFLVKNCELFEASNPCKCGVQAVAAFKSGILKPGRLSDSSSPGQKLRELEILSREVALMRIHPDYAAPEALVENIQSLLGPDFMKT